MMPKGRSRCGFLASSAAVDTESKPIYVKKTIAPPVTMPPKPDGANGFQLLGLTNAPPITRNTRIAPSLIATMMLLASADSRIPRTSKTVRMKIMRKAGTLKYEPVQCPDSHTGVDHLSGKFRPNDASCALVYELNPIATTTLLTTYSRMRSQPMIQAKISPS